MTWGQMGCSPAETARRQAVVMRLNLLSDRKAGCKDTAKVKRIDREIKAIRADESGWLKQVAYWMY